MTDSSKEPSKGAWTPGPWHAFGDGRCGYAISTVADKNGEGVYRIANTDFDDLDMPVQAANALLISKAPQMAELWLDLIEAAGDQKLPLWLVGRLHAAKCLLTDLEVKP